MLTDDDLVLCQQLKDSIATGEAPTGTLSDGWREWYKKVSSGVRAGIVEKTLQNVGYYEQTQNS